MVVDVDAEESPRHFVCICIKNWLPVEILVSNLDQIIIVIIIISGYSLSLPLESKEEGNLFARWWADEVQYYVSK